MKKIRPKPSPRKAAADLVAQMYKPLTTFQKAFDYSIVRHVPQYPHRVPMREVRRLAVVQRMLREHTIESILLEWGRWNVAPVKERCAKTPNDKLILFRWLDDVLGGVSLNGKMGSIDPVTVATFVMTMVYVLRAYLAVNTAPPRPRATREDFERVNREHLIDDAMHAAISDASERWQRQLKRKRKAVRRGNA